ncbi:MAG: serine O-acetyltransferase [Vicinamibacterales bacterium]
MRGPVRQALACLHRVLYRFVRNHYGIELHVETSIGRRVRIAHQSGIVISRYASIGDDCLIRQGVTIGAPSEKRWREAPSLGRGVEVGSGAAILGSISVGDGAHIGAHAVVLTNVPPGASVFVPSARVFQLPTQFREDSGSGLRGNETA